MQFQLGKALHHLRPPSSLELHRHYQEVRPIASEHQEVTADRLRAHWRARAAEVGQQARLRHAIETDLAGLAFQLADSAFATESLAGPSNQAHYSSWVQDYVVHPLMNSPLGLDPYSIDDVHKSNLLEFEE